MINHLPNWNERISKKKARSLFFRGIGYKKSYLTLTGEQCADVSLGRNLKVLDSDVTYLTAVEKDYDAYVGIKKWTADNWNPANCKVVFGEMCDFACPRDYDICFLDYLGNIGPRDILWIYKSLAPKLMLNAHVGMTVSLPTRNNLFIPHMRHWLKKEHPVYYKEVSCQIRDTSEFPNKVMPCITLYSILLNCVMFPNHDFKVDAHMYGEAGSPHTMILFRLLDMKPTSSSLTDEETRIFSGIRELAARAFFKNKIIQVRKPVAQNVIVVSQSDFLTLKETATELGISYFTLRSRLEVVKPNPRKFGSRLVFARSDIPALYEFFHVN